MPLKWTNRSRPPSSGVMNPKPLSSLNHLTVPVAMYSPSAQLACSNRFGHQTAPTKRRKTYQEEPGPTSRSRLSRSATGELGLAGSLVEKRAQRTLEVLGSEQAPRDPADAVVGELDPAFEKVPDHLLGGRVGERRTVGKLMRKLAGSGIEALVGKHAVDHVPALEHRRPERRTGHHQLQSSCAARPLGEALGAAHRRR